MIFNMLIAIMGDSFGRVQDMKEEATLQGKVENLIDNLSVLEDTEGSNRYLVVLSLDDEQGGDEW